MFSVWYFLARLKIKGKFKPWTALKKKPAFNRVVENDWDEDTLEEIREFICDPSALEEAQKVMLDVRKKLKLWMKQGKISQSAYFLNSSDNASMMSNVTNSTKGHETPDRKTEKKAPPDISAQATKEEASTHALPVETAKTKTERRQREATEGETRETKKEGFG